MPDLEWTEETTFNDGARDFRAVGPGVYDVPEEAVEEYLDHRSGGWSEPDGDGSDGEDSEDSEDGFAVLDGTVEEVEAALATGEFDGDLDAMEAAESDGGDRAGVHDAIADRREAVENAGESGGDESEETA